LLLAARQRHLQLDKNTRNGNESFSPFFGFRFLWVERSFERSFTHIPLIKLLHRIIQNYFLMCKRNRASILREFVLFISLANYDLVTAPLISIHTNWDFLALSATSEVLTSPIPRVQIVQALTKRCCDFLSCDSLSQKTRYVRRILNAPLKHLFAYSP
jgi:hypothetical protein